MGSDLLTMVANSVHRYDQSINLGISDSDTAYDMTEMRWCSIMLVITSVVMFVEEHSLRVLAVLLAKSW